MSVGRHMSDALIAKMRGRVEQCRRLARATHDLRAAKVLNEMADEGEADISRYLAEHAARGQSTD